MYNNPVKEGISVDTEFERHIEEYKNITSQMLETHIAKNNDYGNAFEDALNKPELGLTYAAGLLFNKVARFLTLHKHFEISKVNESLEDTLLDLANYCIMTVIWLRKKKI